LRTLLWSPACEAAKILCRKRRTSSSTPRHLMASQSTNGSSGPFTVPPLSATTVVSSVVMASNLPLGSSVLDHLSLRRLTWLASAPFQARAFAPIRPVMRASTGGEPACAARFPVAFRLPAFASRAILPPLRNSASLTVGLPNDDSLGPQRDCHVPHETDT